MSGRRLGTLAALAVAALGTGAVVSYQSLVSLRHERVTDDVHVIFGQGGNVGVLATASGAVVVDTMTLVSQGREIRRLAERLGGGPVQTVVNTHYHWDHTHGNPAFPAGTPIVATERTLAYMHHFDREFWTGAAARTLPNEVFEDATRLEIGGKTVRLVHPGRGHTGGDLVALFVEDRVVHLGDLLFNGRYPNIDLEAAGSVEAWDATLERVLALDFDAVIPGHGPVTDADGIRRFQRFVRELWGVAARAAREGRSLAETIASDELRADAGFAETWIPFLIGLDREFVLRRAWEEATGAVQPERPQQSERPGARAGGDEG